jgi:hypothetical protein
MKTTLALLLVALVGLSITFGSRGGSVGGVTWHADLAQATNLARETDRPLLIVFR